MTKRAKRTSRLVSRRSRTRRPSTRKSRRKSRPVARRSRSVARRSRPVVRRSRSTIRGEDIEIFVYGPGTDHYRIVPPSTAPTVTKLNLCQSKGYYSCNMSPMCNWSGTQNNGECR